LVWVVEAFRVLVREEEKTFLPLAVFSGWLAIAVAAFYYPFNLALMMLFWFILAAVAALNQEKTVLFPLDTLKKNYAASMIFVVLLIGAIALMVQSAKNYYAEVAYLEAVEALRKRYCRGGAKTQRCRRCHEPLAGQLLDGAGAGLLGAGRAGD
jgi:hypothetical protein